MQRVLVTERLADSGLEAMTAAGLAVDTQLGLSPPELLEAVRGASALVIRSVTQVTAEVLEAGAELVVVGRAGIGVDNIDIETATVPRRHGRERAELHRPGERRAHDGDAPRDGAQRRAGEPRPA